MHSAIFGHGGLYCVVSLDFPYTSISVPIDAHAPSVPTFFNFLFGSIRERLKRVSECALICCRRTLNQHVQGSRPCVPTNKSSAYAEVTTSGQGKGCILGSCEVAFLEAHSFCSASTPLEEAQLGLRRRIRVRLTPKVAAIASVRKSLIRA